MTDLIDLHSHLLPDIDDGPRDLDESVQLARAFLTAGIVRVAATPHVNHIHQNRGPLIKERHLALIDRLQAEGIPLRVESGAEIAAEIAIRLEHADLMELTLGGGEWLLIEPSTSETTFDIHKAVFEIKGRGFRVLLAHPERIPAIQEDLELISDLVRGGVRTQITAEALSGRFGRRAQKASDEMFKRGLVHVVASDAHHATERPPGMSKELKYSGHKEMIKWLCHDMPAWILDGGEEPVRPELLEVPDRADRGMLRRLGLRP